MINNAEDARRIANEAAIRKILDKIEIAAGFEEYSLIVSSLTSPQYTKLIEIGFGITEVDDGDMIYW